MLEGVLDDTPQLLCCPFDVDGGRLPLQLLQLLRYLDVTRPPGQSEDGVSKTSRPDAVHFS